MVRSKLVAVMCSTALVGGAVAAPAANAQTKQDGLVNVVVGDVTILEDVNVGVAASVAATLCDVVDVGSVAILANNTDSTSRQSTVCRTDAGKVRLTQN